MNISDIKSKIKTRKNIVYENKNNLEKWLNEIINTVQFNGFILVEYLKKKLIKNKNGIVFYAQNKLIEKFLFNFIFKLI